MTGGLAADAGLHLDLPAPRMLIYGEQNNTHSYLPNLDAAASVELSGIPQCGHPCTPTPPRCGGASTASTPTLSRSDASDRGPSEVTGGQTVPGVRISNSTQPVSVRYGPWGIPGRRDV
jgi:hypothetical protein